MPLRHLLLALAVVAVWGTNFVVIRWGLAELPPFAFAALRFALSSLPLLPFIARPATGWRTLASFGVLLGVGQFGLLFLAMRSDISPGLASLVIQTQVFFTIGLAMLLRGEGLRPLQILGFALALAGMGLIGLHVTGAAGTAGVSALGLLLVLGAAFSWAVANLVARSAGKVDPLGFMVWSSLAAVPPLVGISAGRRRPGPPGPGGGRGQPGRLGRGAVAGGGQHPVRLRRLELAAGALPGRHRGAHGAAGAGLRHAVVQRRAGRAAAPWKLGAAALVLGGLALNLLATRLKAPPAPERGGVPCSGEFW
jgi:O-acetylserine/cysteine efflux transporter